VLFSQTYSATHLVVTNAAASQALVSTFAPPPLPPIFDKIVALAVLRTGTQFTHT
jgi:hypothetical protein